MMRPHIFLFVSGQFLIFLGFGTCAQVIRGKVLDFETKEAILFANIYFNSSFRGTTSDQNGLFELSTIGYEGQGVVISCLGYESWVIQDYVMGKFYTVYLKPSSTVLQEIVVRPDAMPLKRKRRIFIREFLGASENARKCEIANIEDINLVYIKATGVLEAYCYKPIIIHNHSLGYKITYFLDQFEWSADEMHYAGNSIFEEDTCKIDSKRSKMMKRRQMTYSGSRMHLFRELYAGNESTLSFYMQTDGSERKLDKESIIYSNEETAKYLIQSDNIRVTHNNLDSYIIFKDNEMVMFTANGYFDPKHIAFSGEMAKRRVGDLLPYEYWP